MAVAHMSARYCHVVLLCAYCTIVQCSIRTQDVWKQEKSFTVVYLCQWCISLTLLDLWMIWLMNILLEWNSLISQRPSALSSTLVTAAHASHRSFLLDFCLHSFMYSNSLLNLPFMFWINLDRSNFLFGYSLSSCITFFINSIICVILLFVSFLIISYNSNISCLIFSLPMFLRSAWGETESFGKHFVA